MASYDNYIECRAGDNGGYPVLKRLNVSVRVIVEASRRAANFEELSAALPQCTSDEIRAALDYYRDHPQLIDEDIERNRQTWSSLQSAPRPSSPIKTCHLSRS
jgi:uncharacterized protein (DUF433 family)